MPTVSGTKILKIPKPEMVIKPKDELQIQIIDRVMPFNVDFIINTATKLNTKPPINAGTCFINGSGSNLMPKYFHDSTIHLPKPHKY